MSTNVHKTGQRIANTLASRIAELERIASGRELELRQIYDRIVQTLPPAKEEDCPNSDITPRLLAMVEELAGRAFRLDSETELGWVHGRLSTILNLYDDISYFVDGQERPIKERRKVR